MDQDRNDIIDELITRCLTGEASGDEQSQLTKWIARSEENQRHYLHMRKSFELGDQYYSKADNEVTVDIDQEWNRFVAAINKSEKGKVISITPVERPARVWLRVAAALLVLVACGWVIQYFISGNRVTTYTTTASNLIVNLPDGSKVELNRNSELSYSPNFGTQRREITLKGEAFFEVTHDANKPFIVQVKDARVEVLGTSFNVREANADNELEVTVQTGLVKLTGPKKAGELKLKAGEKGIYSPVSGQITHHTNDDVNFLSWKTQKIIFTDANLQSVAATLSHVYGKPIVIKASVPLTCSVTVTFDHQTLEAVLNVLKDTLNLTYEIKEHQIEITQVGC